MFGGDLPPLSWDTRNEYTRNRVELYYQANSAPAISKKQLVKWLQEGDVSTKTAGTDDDMDDRPGNEAFACVNFADFKKQQWVKVDEKATLFSVLSRRDHVVPGIPVFYAVASGSSFYDSFLSGEWSPPAG
ncbi:unnamed protein product [Sphagnum troendelagicum]|uniref:Uncharacterized protein n=1 Tax=Sphagnum troendelagicum TaxID=128251 RepID=A0ABP0U546_9BRYO